MRIALDYDGTYTTDPALWDTFCKLADRLGHEVVCITMRYPTEPIQVPIPVIYTSRQAKVPFMDERGEKVDVWIDDRPHCEDNRWVCEEHPSVNWNGGEGCCGAAGMPCPLCNTGDVPQMEPGTVIIESFFGPLSS